MYFENYSVRVFRDNGIPANEKNQYVSLVNGEKYRIRLKNQDKRDCVCKVTIDGKFMGVFFVNANQQVDLERPAHDSGRFTFYTVDSKEGQELQLSTEVKPNDLGLIEVEFTPIKPEEPVYRALPNEPLSPWKKENSGKPFFLKSNSSKGIRGSGAEQYSRKINLDSMIDGFPQEASASMSYKEEASHNFCSFDMCDEGPATESEKKAGGTGLTGESNVDYKQIHIKPERFMIHETATIKLRLVAVESYNEIRKLTSVPRSTPTPAPV